jgi:hypothetical protein
MRIGSETPQAFAPEAIRRLIGFALSVIAKRRSTDEE